MNCLEAEPYVSSLYDGEPIPSPAARHIAGCETCRLVLNDYSSLAAQLRLAAAVYPSRYPHILREQTCHPLFYLRSRVNIPRFILAALIVCIVAATAASILVRAQSRPLWFQFAWGMNADPNLYPDVAQSGYDNVVGEAGFVHGKSTGATMHIQVKQISANDVELRLRAIRPRWRFMVMQPVGKISLDGTPLIHYKPGTSLAIPVEGGGTFYLKGSVHDVQPKIAFGFALEPPVGLLTMRSPLLVSDDTVLANLPGVDASAGNVNTGAEINAGTQGIFWFGVRPFPRAIRTQAEWGQISFHLDGRNYRLLSPAPFLGGHQPRPVWVRHDPPAGAHDRAVLGIESLPRD